MIRRVVDTEKEESKGLTKVEKARSKELAFYLRYGVDRRHERLNTDSSESSEGSSKRAETFDNENEDAYSPTSASPAPQPEKIEHAELDQELGSRNLTRPGSWRRLGLLFSCITMLKNSIVFVECFAESGGFAFLIPYSVVAMVVGVPMALLELSVAQYASAPLYTIFERIAPALSGVGYSLLAMRVFYTLFISMEPRFLVFMAQSMFSVLTNDTSWSQIQVNGYCVDQMTPAERNRYGKLSMGAYYLNGNRALSMIPSQIYSYTVQLSGNVEQLFSALIMFCVAGYISYRGMRYFSKISILLCLGPLLGALPLTFVLYVHTKARDKVLEEIFDMTDLGKAMSSTGWMNACRAVVKTMLVGDGTLLVVGSTSDFHQNVFLDVLLLASLGTGVRIFLALAFYPVLTIGHKLLYPFASRGYNSGVLQYYLSELFFAALPSFDVSMDLKKFFAVLTFFYLTVSISYIAYQVITFEMLITLCYHTFPRLLYLNEKLVRFCVIAASISFFMSCRIISNLTAYPMYGQEDELFNEHFYIGLLTCAALYEAASISLFYGSKRLLVNILTMISSHKKSYHLFNLIRGVIHVQWSIFIPILSVVTVAGILRRTHVIVDTFSFIFCAISGLPLYIALRQLVMHLRNKESAHVMTLPHRRWGPANINNRRLAEHDERAARIVV
ncbi:unnamed protein product [Caenorhabditis auriculariae]|uniref:Uncharacterized protein n=1 Tax=Caenorhabditis auriculariae TaxID=2777116 RepID=A0A8S1GXH5_9PELO|nr:unnamed protein product [Caenorhabditis auriculariae]